jgi:glycogen operon protein
VNTQFSISFGTPFQLGAVADGNGVNFAVFSENATGIDLCLFSEDGQTELQRIPLPEKTGSVWHGYVPGLRPGAKYGLRAHGSYAPEQGHRFNPHKLLLDPYTREYAGNWIQNNALLGYRKKASQLDLSFDEHDSAPFVPKSVVSDPALFSNTGTTTGWQLNEELIYEAHVKGLTQTHPDVPDDIRGTYEGLASDAIIEHLLKLGVSSIELLPVHAFVDDGFLLEQNLKNYWGYNTIGFFAPEPRYFGPSGILGFRAMVDKFKAAGISVILDVVYNHTAEGDHRGPTICFRGLDNASYYRLLAGQPRYYVNDTGCGNTVNVSHPYVLRMVTDSLRFWVQCMGVQGFRFDLATTLGREDYGFDRRGGFFDALRQDPVLSKVRLIAEPWDIGPGGYRLGEFPAEFSEWNDAYRDTVRRYWRGDVHSAQELGARLLASADRFDRDGKRAWSSINFLTSHDGFTLADTTRYNERHNEANGEDNRDGHHANYSDNCGVEGDTDNKDIIERRVRRQRNMFATLFLSQGTPMLLGGDEISNSQQGNNNAYCQDNDIGWLNWDKSDPEMLQFVQALSAFRKAHIALRQTRFLHGAQRKRDGKPDVQWSDFKGRPLQWRDPGLSCLCVTIRCSAEAPEHDADNDCVFIVFNRDDASTLVKLPPIDRGYQWVKEIDTSVVGDEISSGIQVLDSAYSMQVKGCSVVALAMQEAS